MSISLWFVFEAALVTKVSLAQAVISDEIAEIVRASTTACVRLKGGYAINASFLQSH